VILFLLAFFTIYGSIHFYAFNKLRAAFALTAPLRAAVILLMIFMLLAPLLVRISERYGYESTACFLSYAGYIWMGILFLFLATSVLFDLYRLLIYIAIRMSHSRLSFLIPHPFYLFAAPLIISIFLNVYGYFEAKNIRTEQLAIQTAKIPPEIGRLRIVQISDVHIGMIVRKERLEKIVAAIKQARPDILVSTGDLLDGQIDNMMSFADLFGKIQPQYGKFAVTGNHEFFAGIEQALTFHRQAGFQMLRGESLTLANRISIAGVDDAAGNRSDQYKNAPEEKLLAKLPKETFTLFLKHRPNIDRKSRGLFDLQLSGHTHRGQIYPFTLIIKLVFPYDSGYFKLSERAHLYVNRGVGTWGPPIRLLSPPEITVIDLIHSQEKRP